MDKIYIEKMYNLAVQDFKYAHNEDERWKARKEMASLEAVAFQLFGSDFSDSLGAELRRQYYG